MSTRVEQLLDALNDLEVFFMEYSRLRSSKNPIFVIEGKDDPKFYSSKINSLLGSNWELVSVGGKSKVLEVRSSIRAHPKYKRDSVFFLVDKDFDERVLEEDLYITPCYSIENFYCDPKTIESLVVGECGLSDYKIQRRHEIIEFVVGEYNRLRAAFHCSSKMVAMNSVFLYARKQLTAEKVSLDKILKVEVDLSDGNVSLKLTRKAMYHDKRTQEKLKFYEFFKNDPQWRIVSANPGTLFRGKQEILFLKEFIKLLRDGKFISMRVRQVFGFNFKIENPAMHEHLLSTVAQYVYTPDCLIEFLGKTKALHAA